MTENKKTKNLFTVIILLILTAATLVTSSLAYFKAVLDKSGNHSVMVELIFDSLNMENSNIAAAGYAKIDSDGNEIPWGSERNPYVISQKFHVQNLSVLQNAGFFDQRKDADGNILQSHFLVCDPSDGTPVAIDCGGMVINPVGTEAKPFTGKIDGAIFDGEDSYKNLGVSVSTIANLTVNAAADTPDIGFFGHVSYYGTKNDDKITDGYSSRIENLLFADVTVASSFSIIGSTIEQWWSVLFPNHTNHLALHNESHHIGIVAGHAEFAVIENVSIYYSEDVSAFELKSDEEGSVTNYYTSTGIIGLMEYVNPTITVDENGDQVIDGSGGINDSDISADGTGGGGEGTGSLTGYMLAKTIFDRHEEYLTAENLAKAEDGIYNVREMRKSVDEPLFEGVVMKEGNNTWMKYYIFRDTVFTFALSMATPTNKEGTADNTAAEDPNKVDYVKRIWNLETEAPNIYATSSKDKLQYLDDLDSTPRIVYRLTAVEGTVGSDLSLTAGGYYVLAYHDKGETDSPDDDKIYLFNINAALTNSSVYSASLPAYVIDSGSIYTENENHQTVYDADGNITGISLVGSNKTAYDYAFLYASSDKSINSPDPAIDNALGISTSKEFLSNYTDPVIGRYGADGDTGSWGSEQIYIRNWKFNYAGEGKVAVYNTYEQISTSSWYRIYGWLVIGFDADTAQYTVTQDYERGSDGDIRDEINIAGSQYFTLFKLNANTVTNTNGNINITTLGEGNKEDTPKNIVPVSTTDDEGNTSLDTVYSFDPSKYVLEHDTNSDTYSLAPIRSYYLNNGKSSVLSELNHVVKMYKATEGNYQFTLGDTLDDLFGSSLWGDLFNTNSGGVVGAEIGTTGEYYSIPAGMIAFSINEASVDNPSYINIIVAVNPEQIQAGKIGIWQTEESYASTKFDINNPTDYFMLPVSKTATSNSASERSNIITVSSYTTEIVLEDGKRQYETDTTPSYIYLGGETVFVYHKFTIEEAGIYLLGSGVGSMSVAYFSVTGAAGAGQDGMSGSPIGTIDFVYDNGTDIIPVSNPAPNETLIEEEDYQYYYPSYYFLTMLPEIKDGATVLIQNNSIKIRRYIDETDSVGTKRHIVVTDTGPVPAKPKPISEFFTDVQDDLDTSE